MKKIIFTALMTLCAFTFTMAQYNEGIKVNFKGNKPNISDFVTAVLSQEELGEGLGGMVEIWEKHLKGQPLPKGHKITVDAKNGYVSYEYTLEEENQTVSSSSAIGTAPTDNTSCWDRTRKCL